MPGVSNVVIRFSTTVLGAIAALILPGVARGAPIIPEGFQELQRSLEGYEFVVRLEIPPLRGAYGLLQPQSKTIWINPVVFELGNAESVLIHEAVHAAQLCAGQGKQLRALGLEIPPPAISRRYFLRYHNLRRQLEAEAYTIPAQPNARELALSLLQERCGER